MLSAGSSTAGAVSVLQQIPCCVGAGTPSDAMVPLAVAEVVPMPSTARVITWGGRGRLLKVTSLPWSCRPCSWHRPARNTSCRGSGPSCST